MDHVGVVSYASGARHRVGAGHDPYGADPMNMPEQMTEKPQRASRVNTISKRDVLGFLVTIFLTGLAGAILFQPGIIGGPVSIIIEIGMDPLRAQFIAALIMTVGSALVGAALGRRKFASVIGGGIVLWFGFLNGFIQSQLRPVLDPGGNVALLNSDILLHNSLLILCLGIISAFIGAAIGVAVGETLIDPVYDLASIVWQRWTNANFSPEATLTRIRISRMRLSRMKGTLLLRWGTAIGMVVILIQAANARDLFVISPDVGIHAFRVQSGHALAGTVVSDSVVSEALNKQSRSFLVYLPPSYNSAMGQKKSYPVLYLLHGTPGKDIDWINGGKVDESANTLIATGKISQLVMVFPDGNGELKGSSEWGNSYDQRQLMETFVANDLVRYIDKHYRIIADAAHRAIGGLSTGAFGAMNIAIHHPDIFGSVISLGGYYQAEGPIWGQDEAYRQANSPSSSILHSRQAWQLQMFLGAATQDEPYYTDTQQFVKVVANLHIRYQLDIEKGYHSWSVWQTQIYKGLVWLSWGKS